MPTVRLNINPQTQVRSTEGDAILFRIPFDQLRPPGKKRFLRIERYNKYKDSLFDIANEIGFKVPADEYHRLMFFIPMPKTWRKWKREANNGRKHQSRPDWDNFSKAFYDALMPVRDQSVWDVRVTKTWTDHSEGWIEVIWGEDLDGF